MPILARAPARARMPSMYRTKTKRQARAGELRDAGVHAAARHTPARARPGAQAAPAGGGRRIQVRRSGVHGKGVFALRPIAAGERIIEYVGEVLTWAAAQKRHPHDPSDPNHTFFFHIDDKHVIDGKVGGNAARWINHSCAPNCETHEDDRGRVFITARRPIREGEELSYDYRLAVEGKVGARMRKAYACRCGARRCRGTMLAPRRR